MAQVKYVLHASCGVSTCTSYGQMHALVYGDKSYSSTALEDTLAEASLYLYRVLRHTMSAGLLRIIGTLETSTMYSSTQYKRYYAEATPTELGFNSNFVRLHTASL